MRPSLTRLLLCGMLTVALSGVRTEARSDERTNASATDSVALRELLEGKKGYRETWQKAPALVIVDSVMEYAEGDLTTGYTATSERMTDEERERLVADLTRALVELTGGQLTAFSTVGTETAEPGQTVKVLRTGQIVAGRFRGVRTKTGSIGYGGRMTRQGRITAAVVMVDLDADRNPKQQLVVRTHELGHALGYNHVEARPSIMNPRASGGLTEFDRMAIKLAFPPVPVN